MRRSRGQDRLVGLAGGAGHRDLAGAVAGEVGVEVAAGELFGLRARGGGGQLGVGDAAVAGEAAAGGRGGDVDVVGEGLGERAERVREAEAAGRAGRVDGGGSRPSPSISRLGSSRSAQATESTISSFASRSAFSSESTPSPGSAIAPVQEAASITTGSSPSPLHRQSRSTISFALCRCAASNPFELQGNPQQLPATSSGIQPASQPEPKPSTSASTTASPQRSKMPVACSSARPKIRFVQLARTPQRPARSGDPLRTTRPAVVRRGSPAPPSGRPGQALPALRPPRQRPADPQRQLARPSRPPPNASPPPTPPVPPAPHAAPSAAP